MSDTNQPTYEEDEITLKEVILKIQEFILEAWRHKWWILAAVALGTAAHAEQITVFGPWLGPDQANVEQVLSAQMGKAGPPMDGRDFHIGDLSRGILPPAAPLAISTPEIVALGLTGVPEFGPDTVTEKVYRLPEGKLAALTELMVRSDVPVLVSPGDESITVHGTMADPRWLDPTIEHDAVDRLIGGIKDTDRQSVLPAGANRVGHVEHKRRLAVFVLADARAVQPDLRQIVHRPEPQQTASVGVRTGRRGKLPPVPSHAVIAGKRVLDDPRHLGRLGFRSGHLEPLFFPPHVLRIGRQQPPVAVERNDGGTHRLTRGH